MDLLPLPAIRPYSDFCPNHWALPVNNYRNLGWVRLDRRRGWLPNKQPSEGEIIPFNLNIRCLACTIYDIVHYLKEHQSEEDALEDVFTMAMEIETRLLDNTIQLTINEMDILKGIPLFYKLKKISPMPEFTMEWQLIITLVDNDHEISTIGNPKFITIVI